MNFELWSHTSADQILWKPDSRLTDICHKSQEKGENPSQCQCELHCIQHIRQTYPITIDYRVFQYLSFQSYSTIYLPPVLWFMCQGRAHFHKHWGDFPKMAMKSPIIGLDSYIIPHFKANMSWYASVSQQSLFYKHVPCEYRLNGSKVTNWKRSDFWKKNLRYLSPPTQQNWV